MTSQGLSQPLAIAIGTIFIVLAFVVADFLQKRDTSSEWYSVLVLIIGLLALALIAAGTFHPHAVPRAEDSAGDAMVEDCVTNRDAAACDAISTRLRTTCFDDVATCRAAVQCWSNRAVLIINIEREREAGSANPRGQARVNQMENQFTTMSCPAPVPIVQRP